MRLTPEYLVREYQERIYRTAFSICGNRQDAEDVVQNTFLKYIQSSREFESEEHIKAWLIRTAVNLSKNMVTAFWHRNKVPLEDYLETVPFESPGDAGLIEAVLALPVNYRIVIHLYYYEEYSIRDISRILRISESAVKNRLLRGRRRLKESLDESADDRETEWLPATALPSDKTKSI